MTDLESQLTDTMRARADGPVDSDLLLAAAVLAGRRGGRRRAALTAGGVVLAIAIVGGGVSGVLRSTSAGERDRPATPSALTPGTDPFALHLGLEERPFGLQISSSRVAPGLEELRLLADEVPVAPLTRPSTLPVGVDVHLAGDVDTLPVPWSEPGVLGEKPRTVERPVTVDGRAGTLLEVSEAVSSGPAGVTFSVTGYVVRWQPAVGSWAQVAPDSHPGEQGERVALTIAEAVSVDASSRCTVPFTLTTVPEDFRAVGCASGGRVAVAKEARPGSWSWLRSEEVSRSKGRVTISPGRGLGAPVGGAMVTMVGRGSGPDTPSATTITVAGSPAVWDAASRSLRVLDLGGRAVEVRVAPGAGGLETARALVEGLRWVADSEDRSSWTDRPLG